MERGSVIETGDGRPALRFERHVRHAPEKVWRAITEPEHLRSWFPAVVEFDLSPGARLRFGVTPEQIRRYGMDPGHVTEGEVLRADPPKLLEFTWGEELLRWELTSDGEGGCHVVFTNVVDDRDTLAPAAAGWHAGLEVMLAQLDGRDVDWSPFDRAEELAQLYG
ncbi:SRPBCC family protein [Prauserella sp. ASG 168]|uniref:SRPBCC family protein n=1 Tax=Prauserella cavernicola TaxID=2800127 RepID=A0A934V7F6_9PSEU|nr:SRPBCC family protein [Prauserella cavernicola]